MEEGTVARWLVETGAEVTKGQPLVEIDTDKATVVYESDAAGTVLELLVAEGESAAIGAPIARVGAAGEATPPRKVLYADNTPENADWIKMSFDIPDVDDAESFARYLAGSSFTVAQFRALPLYKNIKGDARYPWLEDGLALAEAREAPAAARAANVSPVARRLAETLGVDLATVKGTGPGGMIGRGDVEAAAGGASPERAPLTRVQQTIARRMVEGASAPTFSAEVELDLTAAFELRAGLGGEPKPSLNDLVVKAVALALRDFPRLNGSYSEAGFELHDTIDVGIAVDAGDALLVPVVRGADTLSLRELARASRELAERARAGTIAPDELQGGTFTITNLGALGIVSFVPILNPPQAAILSVGAAIARPVVDAGGEIVVRRLASATLVCDHRIVYGAEAARFLARVRELIEQPARLV
jgi:pyruvate dehydrogenase E2 component (dihydrolipoamide acetyltransferase)